MVSVYRNHSTDAAPCWGLKDGCRSHIRIHLQKRGGSMQAGYRLRNEQGRFESFRPLGGVV